MKKYPDSSTYDVWPLSTVRPQKMFERQRKPKSVSRLLKLQVRIALLGRLLERQLQLV